MKYRNDLTAERIRELLDYNKNTGELMWKTARQNVIKGKLAGHKHMNRPEYIKYGGMRITIEGNKYFVHRIIWLWVTSKWPANQIDHINGNSFDNRWCNLREATHTQNQRNKRRTKCASGIKGVYEKKEGWYVRPYLGPFISKTMAAKVYDEVMKKYHADFAYLNEVENEQ